MWHYNRFTKEDFVAAFAFFRQSAAKDAAFAQPLAAIAVICVAEVLFTWAKNPAAEVAEAHRLASAAVENDPADSMERAVRISPRDPQLAVRLGAQSAALYLDGDYERALDLARLAVRHGPRYPMAHCHLANALGQLGRTDEARTALATFLELSPNFTMETARQASPFRDNADFERFLEGLRKAGW